MISKFSSLFGKINETGEKYRHFGRHWIFINGFSDGRGCGQSGYVCKRNINKLSPRRTSAKLAAIFSRVKRSCDAIILFIFFLYPSSLSLALFVLFRIVAFSYAIVLQPSARAGTGCLISASKNIQDSDSGSPYLLFSEFFKNKYIYIYSHIFLRSDL